MPWRLFSIDSWACAENILVQNDSMLSSFLCHVWYDLPLPHTDKVLRMTCWPPGVWRHSERWLVHTGDLGSPIAHPRMSQAIVASRQDIDVAYRFVYTVPRTRLLGSDWFLIISVGHLGQCTGALFMSSHDDSPEILYMVSNLLSNRDLLWWLYR